MTIARATIHHGSTGQRYMSGIVFYDTYADAEKAFKGWPNTVLEKHKCGSGAIVTLADSPIQRGQQAYIGGKQ